MSPETDHATHVLMAGGGYAVLWGIDALPTAYAVLSNRPESSGS